VDQAEAWFARHGGKTVLLGRMLPVFRVLISVPAGVERMPVARFAGYTAAGSLVWNTVFVVAGYLLGEQWERVGNLRQPALEDRGDPDRRRGRGLRDVPAAP
jgi:membrane protein DedA with SNARE-associated domain